MKRIVLFSSFVLGLVACVTINVYFPSAAAQAAADEVIEDIIGPKGDGEPQGRLPAGNFTLVALAGGLANFLIAPAQAQEADIDISSPAVRNIRASMKERFGLLEPYFDSGALGFGADAMIVIRDPAAVPLKERNTLRKLEADENADREALYREIAVANGHPEWEGKIRATFAARWIANARRGWYHQDDGGTWRRK